jgi:hypothetical protein
MKPGQRSDPGKLAKEREKIRKDIEAREAPKTNPLQDLVTETKKKINIRRQRKNGYGSVPQVPGALQHGFRDVNKDT